MKTFIVIPAHYGSTRLAGKVLLDIAGKPMVQHVYERAKKSRADQVMIATDDQRVFETAKDFGADIYMTAATHRSGTERASELVDRLKMADDDIVIVLQADEPLVPVVILDQLIDILKQKPDLSVATLCDPIDNMNDVFDPNVTRAVLDKNNFALYFSHAPMPWYRNGFSKEQKELPKDFNYYRHIGIYGYRAAFVRRYIKMPASQIEFVECLEQLRILWNSEKIYVAIAKEKPGPGVDTQEDLNRVRELLKNL